MSHLGKTIEQRFWEKVVKTETCWLWASSNNDEGYSQLWANGKHIYAHRYSYELHKGPIPKGKLILHSCDTPRCVNPEHLRVGTHRENMDEAKAKKRIGKPGMKWLTKEQRERLVQMRKKGVKVTTVAKEFGIALRTVRKITREHI